MRMRELANYSVRQSTILSLKLRRLIQEDCRLLKKYDRDNQGRFEAFKDYLSIPASSLDIGCEMGFFTFKMAKYGFAIGIDSDKHRIELARGKAMIEQTPGIAFACLEINPENIESLPHVDTILFMAVFHHWIVRHGKAVAIDMLDILTSHCKYLIFETGQPEEHRTWATEVSFLNPKWIYKRFKLLGFDAIRVGRFPRNLYVAIRGNHETMD